MHPYVAMVLSHGMATLGMLEHSLSFDDLLDMIEIIQVNEYNRSLCLEDALKELKK